MAVINIKIDSITGSSVRAGHKDQIVALGLRDSIVAPPGTASESRYADIQVIRYRDASSPKLSEACAASVNLGTVTISLFRTSDAGMKPYMVYTLAKTYISRIETETLDDAGAVFLPHMGSFGNTNPSPANGLAAMLVSAANKDTRLAPLPYTALPKGSAKEKEVERVWFNAPQVRWTYTPYDKGVAGGAIEKEWNFAKGED